MKNTINLTKIYLKQTLAQLFSRKNKKKTSSNVIFAILLFAFVAAAMGFAYYGFGEQFVAAGSPSMVIVIGLVFSSFLILLMNINTMQGQYYQSHDYEMLSSMPIKTFSIVTAKYLNSYLVSLIYSLTIALPAFVIYFVFNPITVVSIVYSIIALLLIPTYMQLIASILSYLLNLITCKLKNKNLINNIMTVIVTVFTIGFVVLSNNGLIGQLFSSGIPLWLKIILPHVYFLYNAIVSGSFLQFLIFIALTLAFALISVLLVSTQFKRINSSKISSSKNKAKVIKFKQHAPILSLMRKEARTFFSSAIYFINCLIGPFLSIALAITLGLTFKDQIANNILPAEMANAIFLCSCALTICMMPASASSISMEGRNFFVIKSLPIKYHQFIGSKLLFSFILNIPFILISIIIFSAITGSSISAIIIMFLISIVLTLLSSCIGLLSNLKWPKLVWDNETVAIKQGFSVFVTLMSSIVFCAINLIPYLLLFFDINAVLSFVEYFAIMFAFYLVLLAILITLLFKQGKKMYNKIS